MGSSRALLRLAWRDARRDRWRTVLVVVLVTLPVALLGGAITVFDSVTATPEQRALDWMGDADATVRPSDELLLELAEETGGPAGVDAIEARLRAELPDGSRIAGNAQVPDTLELPGERVEIVLDDRPLAGDHLGVGIFRLVDGDAPTARDEVALTEDLAAHLDIEVGDSLTFASFGDVEVVAIARRPELLDDRRVLTAPGAIVSELDTSGEGPGYYLELFVELPPGPLPVVGEGATSGTPGEPEVLRQLQPFDAVATPDWWVTTRAELVDQRFSEGERWLFVIVGGLAVVEVALIVGAAFAVSVRRRQRELGLLAAVGGTPTHVRRVVLLNGLVAGTLGAVLGTALGIAGAAGMTPWLESLARREIAGLRLDGAWLLGVALVGVASTLLGAWWPARSVARLPTTVALSGRRPPASPSVRGLRAGLAVVAAAVAMLLFAVIQAVDTPFLFLAGSVLLVLGVGLTSAWWLEQLGRLAPRLPVGPRLALRDAARFRTRNGPIVTAAMAGLAGAISVATVLTSMDQHDAATYTPQMEPDQVTIQGPDAPDVAQRAVAEFGGTTSTFAPTNANLRPVEGADVDPELAVYGIVATTDPDGAEALAGADAAAALERGEVVLLGRDLDEVAVSVWEAPAAGGESQEVELGAWPSVSVEPPGGALPEFGPLPVALLPPELASEVEDYGETVLLELPGAADQETHDRLVELAGGPPGDTFVTTELGYVSMYRTPLLVVLALGAVTGLALVGVAIALASAEARGDLRTLTAVGADRRTRSSLAAGRALLLSGLGGLLAVPVGLVPGAAVLWRMSDVELAVPWAAIAIVVVAVPVVATAGAALLSRRDPGPSLRVVA